MLLALMYHRVWIDPKVYKYGNTHSMLREHLMFLKEHYCTVLPGDLLLKRKLYVCLTFDDATYDFYHYVYPLLQELEIRVLLGIPVHYILDRTDLSASTRLDVPYSIMMQEGIYDTKAPFCTWQELNEMVASGWVEVASHSYLHCNLTFDFVDLQREVVRSKEVIEQKVAQPVTSFIYPFGRMTPALHEFVARHYPYAFRIGSALNFGWGNGKKALTRLSADNLHTHADCLSRWNLTKAFCKALLT